jgi:hypothetical protein
MIARSRDNLQLLLTLGYSPGWLSKAVAKTWIPVYIIVIITAVVITAIVNYLFVKISFVEKSDLSLFIHWSVIITAIILLTLSVFSNYNLVKKELYKL